MSTDDRTSRQHQQTNKPESVNNAAALRRRMPSRARGADGPQLRSVTPVVSQFPDPVTADLTARQKRILEFIRDWVERYGYPPSVREIGEGGEHRVGRVGQGAAQGVVDALVQPDRAGALLAGLAGEDQDGL